MDFSQYYTWCRNVSGFGELDGKAFLVKKVGGTDMVDEGTLSKFRDYLDELDEKLRKKIADGGFSMDDIRANLSSVSGNTFWFCTDESWNTVSVDPKGEKFRKECQDAFDKKCKDLKMIAYLDNLRKELGI